MSDLPNQPTPTAETSSSGITKFSGWIALVLASVFVGGRLWLSFNFFPLAEWNMVRLAPTFMLGGGLTPYPGLTDGALTTWIYGPLPLMSNAPALLADNAISALLMAGANNLAMAVVPLVVAIWIIAKPSKGDLQTAVFWPVLLALALWPNAHLQYFQADNLAIAATILSTVCLQASGGQTGRLHWLAALCAAAATWSKQPFLLIIPAQLIWLAVVADRRSVVHYTLRCALIGISMAGAFVFWFGWNPLWLNLVQIPGQLPWAPDIASRMLAFKWHLGGWVLLPALGLFIWHRHIWMARSPWLLPSLTWLALLPLGLTGALRIGGATNSLSGALVFIPLLVCWGFERFRALTSIRAPVGAATAIVFIVCLQVINMPVAPLAPRTAHLNQATQIAESFPEQVYFPWHPLITWFSEGRFDHAEDGLYTRQVAGIDIEATTREGAFLPPRWHMTAIPGWRHEGVYTELQSTSAEMGQFESWSLYLWEPQPEVDLDSD